jgi:hypothetical protein
MLSSIVGYNLSRCKCSVIFREASPFFQKKGAKRRKSEVLKTFVRWVLFTTAFNEDSFAENEMKTPKGWCIFVNRGFLNDLNFFVDYFNIKEIKKILTL